MKKIIFIILLGIFVSCSENTDTCKVQVNEINNYYDELIESNSLNYSELIRLNKDREGKLIKLNCND